MKFFYELFVATFIAVIPLYSTATDNPAATTGRPDMFMKGLLADKQIIKFAFCGASNFYSGMVAPVKDGTRGFASLEYEHFAKKLMDYFDYNKPVFRGIHHKDWRITGNPREKPAWYPYNSTHSGDYIVLQKGMSAEIKNITGFKTAVLVFEGGIKDNSKYDTGIAEIQVSADNGKTWNKPSEARLKGKLTKFGFGKKKVFTEPEDNFNTAFEYPPDAYRPMKANTGTCPIREAVYQLDPEKKYCFRIQPAPNSDKPVHLWGIYYFSGQTFIPVNLAYPGADTRKLRQITYNAFVLSGVDYVLCGISSYHDHKPENMIRKDIDAFINEVKKYGIELALTSYTPGGIITEPFVSKMGDEEPPYYPGENFMWIFDHRKAVKLNKIPEYKNYPEKNAAYKLIVRGKEYTGRNPLIKPDSSKYKHWHYRNKLVLVFNPPMPDFTKASYPLEFKKVKGNGGEILYGKEVHYMPPPIGRHREIVKQQAAANNIAFLDILGAFERVAESVGETLYTPGYEMRHGHPWWKMLDSKSRKMTLLLASDKALPARKDIFEAIINGEKRYFTVLSVNKAAKSVKLYSVESPNGEYIYPGDLETIPNRDSLWKNTEYKKVSGKGTVKSFIPIGILLITDAVRPIKMNYMSNYFSRKDGHHLASPAINLMFEIMKDVIFSNSTYVKNRPEHQRLRK